MPAQSSTAGTQSPAAMEIRFSQIGLIQLQLRSIDPDSIIEQLDERMTAAPRFFERMPVGLDISALQQTPSATEMQAVLGAVQRAGLVSIGLISGCAGVDALAGELHLPVLGSLQGRPTAAPALAPVVHAAPSPAPEAPPVLKEIPSLQPAAKEPPLYQLRQVRSGQRVYARNRDLVVLANVGSGAEVIADGSVHVYGTLRGRVIAGAQSDRTARVFCTDFRAELISIAGVFRLFETFPDGIEGRPVHVWLIKEDLRLARIGGPPSPSHPRPPQPPKENAP